MVRGDAASVPACFLPDGLDYADMEEMLAAGPEDSEYAMKTALQSLAPEADMPIIEMVENSGGSVKIIWEVTFRNGTSIEGHTFAAGTRINMDTLVVKSGDSWLIHGM